MAKIQTYALADTPLSFSDKLIGTEVNGPILNATKNFSLGELYNLFATLPNVGDLQETLNAGNTATQNINLTGQINVTSIRPTDILDRFGSSGEVFQVLSRAVTGINWVNVPVDTLQAVLNAGNTATQNIVLTGNVTSTRVIPGNIQDVTGSIGSTGQILFKSSTGPLWANSSATSPSLQQVTDVGNTTTDDVNVNSLGVLDSVLLGYSNISSAAGGFDFKDLSGNKILLIENSLLELHQTTNIAATFRIPENFSSSQIYDFPASSGTIPLTVNGVSADTSGSITIPVGSTQDLQQVTDEGSSTTNPITITTQNVTSLVVNSNSDEDDSQGISVYGGYLAIGATAVNNAIFATAESIGIKTEATGGISLLTKLSNDTLEGVRIESSYLSTGTPLRITKADSVGTLVDKLTVNQAGELTATKLIKEGGTNLQYLMADGSTTTGGSGGGGFEMNFMLMGA